MDEVTRKHILELQRNEITEYHVYRKLAKDCRNTKNLKILNSIAKDELKHYNIWKEVTKTDIKPSRTKILKYIFFSKLFGLTFGLALMERGELSAQTTYNKLSTKYPQLRSIIKDEGKHEKELIDLIKEEKLEYISSIVLGINDALVELTGALAGFTFALQNASLIAIVGLITGIAASLSMASSEYLSMRAEKDNGRNPRSAALYTGLAYFVTVAILVVPFFVLSNPYLSLAWTVTNAILIIALFTYFMAVTKGLSYRKRFFEMALISLGVAAVSFFIGFVIRTFFGVDL